MNTQEHIAAARNERRAIIAEIEGWLEESEAVVQLETRGGNTVKESFARGDVMATRRVLDFIKARDV